MSEKLQEIIKDKDYFIRIQQQELNRLREIIKLKDAGLQQIYNRCEELKNSEDQYIACMDIAQQALKVVEMHFGN